MSWNLIAWKFRLMNEWQPKYHGFLNAIVLVIYFFYQSCLAESHMVRVDLFQELWCLSSLCSCVQMKSGCSTAHTQAEKETKVNIFIFFHGDLFSTDRLFILKN